MQIIPKWSGLTPYTLGLNLQKSAFEIVRNNTNEIHLLGMEHPEVLTLGLRSHEDPLIPLYKKQFKEVIKIRRGGHLVVHNPGQLVIYPVLSLRANTLSIRDYVCLLTNITKQVLNEFEIETFEKKEPGLFTEKGKIAMFGVGVKHGITQHGICLNVKNNLSVFSKIALCDIKDQSMDSIELHSPHTDLGRLFESWSKAFTQKFLKLTST